MLLWKEENEGLPEAVKLAFVDAGVVVVAVTEVEEEPLLFPFWLCSPCNLALLSDLSVVVSISATC